MVLCAGRIDYAQLPLAFAASNAMVPVAGRPVISWIIDDLLAKGIDRDIAVVHRVDDVGIAEFITRIYSRRARIKLAPREHRGSILDSLATGLEALPASTAGVRVVVGDSLIRDPFDTPGDLLYAFERTDVAKWCIVRVDASGRPIEYVDKGNRALEGTQLALAGYYQFADRQLLEQTLRRAIDDDDRELSGVLRRYGDARPFRVDIAREVFDFGHIENLASARHRLLSARSFNQISVDPVLGTITKRSRRVDKIRDELAWYEGLPAALKALTPRVLSVTDSGDSVALTQEFYGYPTLAELYVCGNLSIDSWRDILLRLMHILERFRDYPGDLSPHDVAKMYGGKTAARLDMLRGRGGWDRLLDAPQLSINGKPLLGLPALRDHIGRRSAEIVATSSVSIIHGDLCFSNVLYDYHTQIIRLIDPRGQFGKPGIYGDPRYDLAKLRHSISGYYDFLIAGLFTLVEGRPLEFDFAVHEAEVARTLPFVFDSIIGGGQPLRDVQFIEALLFLSMTPLHKDVPARQLAMFLTGLRLLNEERELDE